MGRRLGSCVTASIRRLMQNNGLKSRFGHHLEMHSPKQTRCRRLRAEQPRRCVKSHTRTRTHTRARAHTYIHTSQDSQTRRARQRQRVKRKRQEPLELQDPEPEEGVWRREPEGETHNPKKERRSDTDIRGLPMAYTESVFNQPPRRGKWQLAHARAHTDARTHAHTHARTHARTRGGETFLQKTAVRAALGPTPS